MYTLIDILNKNLKITSNLVHQLHHTFLSAHFSQSNKGKVTSIHLSSTFQPKQSYCMRFPLFTRHRFSATRPLTMAPTAPPISVPTAPLTPVSTLSPNGSANCSSNSGAHFSYSTSPTAPPATPVPTAPAVIPVPTAHTGSHCSSCNTGSHCSSCNTGSHCSYTGSHCSSNTGCASYTGSYSSNKRQWFPLILHWFPMILWQQTPISSSQWHHSPLRLCTPMLAASPTASHHCSNSANTDMQHFTWSKMYSLIKCACQLVFLDHLDCSLKLANDARLVLQCFNGYCSNSNWLFFKPTWIDTENDRPAHKRWSAVIHCMLATF